MIPEIGQFSLILALCFSLIQSIFPLAGTMCNIPQWVALARPVTRIQLGFMLIAYGCLTYAFITHDFSVQYVANNSNTSLPFIYLISGVWGAHEGSLLLWALVLSLWSGAVSIFARSVPEDMLARVLSVMGMVSVGFLLFMLLTSNPFDRMIPAAVEGRDLNPLLQDPGLIIHPPMLYMGYVGFSVAFAFAIAALIGGKLDAAWARWARPWTNVAWMFLTAGIALGSWWAYYELGWGGWWFWDPVENASFMPWLVGTALIHSLAVTEKRGAFKAWTVLLALFAFSLSLLGTFLVRSGVLTSVHAFASDPTRGVFILLFLGVVVGGSLLLYAWRAPKLRSTVGFQIISRETGLLLNNIFMVTAAASILLGTLYPLLMDALNLGKISVGPPYFNSIFIPLMTPIAMFVGVTAISRWKGDSVARLFRRLQVPLVFSLIAGIAFPSIVMGKFNWAAAFGMVLAIWVTTTTLLGFYDRLKTKGLSVKAIISLGGGFVGMTIAHLGIAVFIVGVTLTSIYSEEKDVRLLPGESYELGGFTFTFAGVTNYDGPNFRAAQGLIYASRGSEPRIEMKPQKRIYKVQQNPMTEAAIDAGFTRDLFVALGEQLDDKGAWSLRLYHKPYIRWIWFGAIFMGLGGLIAAGDRRYRMYKKRSHDMQGAV